MGYATVRSSCWSSWSPAGDSTSSSASTSSASARATRTASRITGGAGAAPAASRRVRPQHALELREHRLVGAQVLVGQRTVELLEQLALRAVEAAGDDDVDHDAQVA